MMIRPVTVSFVSSIVVSIQCFGTCCAFGVVWVRVTVVAFVSSVRAMVSFAFFDSMTGGSVFRFAY